ncbi:unnamed protein product [Peronospora effusa]|uniref:Uncharacterized protein n=1 Tax=Peronospora effusa TaxID=542832 RepID=A0A3M6VHZ1_9STRA|nr:hypothetical protein DD238_003089 [Peronospora effusa]RQM15575.1 hypothetical protein DD237_003853 [Peronospora effusa]CAI5715446.1 unnamed protein product [Peronospora effusa]
MFWSAALDLKTQRPPPRPSYGSFNRLANTSSFRIPQSIPEHQPVSQFTSPIPARIEEYYERPDTAVARTRASLQLSEHTQLALKLLLQGERDSKSKSSTTTLSKSKVKRAPEMNKISHYSARRTPRKELPERTPLLKPLARVYDEKEFTPQENSNEHNYWMQELEKRRAGMKTSRQRMCTTMSERATTSPLKVGVVMCSVPLVLVLGFVLFVMLFGDGSDVSTNVTSTMSNLLGFGEDADTMRARYDTDRIARAFAFPPETNQLEKESLVLTLALPAEQTKLRGSLKEIAGR